MKSMQGMVLLTVIIFLQALMVLGLCAMQMAWLANKTNQSIWVKNSINEESKSISKIIEEKIMKTPDCAISEMPTEKLLAQPLTWWQTAVSCKGNLTDFHYFYVVEFLGEDPCAILQLDPEHSSYYYRISILGLKHNIKVIMQSTIIKPDRKSNLLCKLKRYMVSPGRQMWRTYDIE